MHVCVYAYSMIIIRHLTRLLPVARIGAGSINFYVNLRPAIIRFVHSRIENTLKIWTMFSCQLYSPQTVSALQVRIRALFLVVPGTSVSRGLNVGAFQVESMPDYNLSVSCSRSTFWWSTCRRSGATKMCTISR